MSDGFFSTSWYRVARLRPRLRRHVEFHRHRYRGRLWYVLQDHSTGRCQRLTPAAYLLAGLMNGERTTQEIWEAACARLGDDAPSQDETIRVLGLLHFADALRCDVSPDTVEILRRCQRRERAEWWRRFANPLAFRIPLVDPDEFLSRWAHLARPLYGRAAAAVWLGLVGGAVVLATAHWRELSENAAEQLLDPRNLLLLWLVYPLMKALHELGHAFAAKVFGGAVHEMGVLLLVFVPVPYVDASSASVLPEKWKRVVVGAAGVAVEIFLAALSLLVWLHTEPGVVRSIAYNAMWIGGASALLFNGNPLLRFDGYYVLSDLVEIPNLRARSNQYLTYLTLHHGFGLTKVRCPASSRGEAPWFVVYGIAAWAYRLVVVLAIALFVSTRFFTLGILLAALCVGLQVVAPLLRGAAFVLTSPRLSMRRGRALALSAVGLGTAVLLLVGVPLPLYTRAEGVVWPPEGAQVRAAADGFVVRTLVSPEASVELGDPLVLTRDPSLEARVAVMEGRLRELRARHHAERTHDRVRAQMTADEVASAEATLARARERQTEVVIRSPRDGTFVVPRWQDLEGGYLKQGDLVGYVIGPATTTARVVVPQSDATLIQERTRAVHVRLSRRPSQVLTARVRREVPAATNQLPSSALGTAGGGRIPVDPRDPEGRLALTSVFQLDLELPEHAAVREIGGRVHVRFDHGAEPVAWRGWRSLRRLFLRRIGV
jgi:putative peptide zinc metalloprotease protein